MALSHATLATPVGELHLFATDTALCGAYWAGRPMPDAARLAPSHPVLAAATAQLRAYLAGARDGFDLPLALEGTAFQRAVWTALRDIPLGETRTYQELAAAVGRPRAVRAVGAANARNPLSVIVPCHRLVGPRGELRGYAGGLAAKAWLLRREGAEDRARPRSEPYTLA